MTEADPGAASPAAGDPGPASRAAAARRVLDDDGRRFVLQPWQVAYLFALVEGRPPVVPPGCGVGKGWLEARLREVGADVHDEDQAGWS